MMKCSACCPKMRNYGLLGLRIALGLVFILAGWDKFMHIEGAMAGFASWGFPEWMAYLVAAIELVGGLMILLGIWAHKAAGVLALVMLVAVFKVSLGGPLMGYYAPLSALAACLGLMGCGAGDFALMKSCCKDKAMNM